MKIAIAGAGMSGAYMYRLLKERGFDQVDLYDVKRTTRCGRHPCAWGMSPSAEYRRLVSRFADPDKFIMLRTTEVSIEGVKMPGDVVTVDKPALLDDLTGGVPIFYSPIQTQEYDRVIDATGAERAYLGPMDGQDFVADTIQYRIRSPQDLGMRFNLNSIGYEWCFPLGNGEYHVGFGNLKASTAEYQLSISFDPSERVTRCKCLSKIRLTSPLSSQPFYRGNVVGVGEAVGAVGPIAGDGNLYAMQTAEMLMDDWDRPERYARAVLKKYRWMHKERLALERLLGGHMPTLSNALTFKQHCKRAGIKMTVPHIVSLFRKMLDSS
ncbi:NAD(P)/FAD-dependent oxidoreductase [Methanomassiliicoccus luminyensis]|uniref:NAD(P)/FAD-dependent oxidoreductase n=1 Tax=Methanomassiliicoccus luminyensis TaxID=1080712 RepID=UPI00037A7CA9|nr:NAD(P)/FAD-dependent oxidoreductase [Methanomassiliicoccus luminyensis]